jgi:hypothetical protein
MMCLVREFIAAHHLLEENEIGYSETLHRDVMEKLSGKDATTIFELFTLYIQATIDMHTAGKKLYAPGSDFAGVIPEFETALRHYETRQKDLVTAVYGPR